MMVADMGLRDIGSPLDVHSNGAMDSHYGRESFQRSDSRSEGSDSYSEMTNGKRKEYFTQRKRREFIPDSKKDESYWDRRRRNNEAAKRSREKRRFNDMILETRVVELSKENHLLKAQLAAIKEKYGISGESVISVEQVMAAFPNNEQVLNQTKRVKLVSPSPVFPAAQGSPPHSMHIFPVAQQPLPEQTYAMQDPQAPYTFPLPSLLQPQLDVANNSVLNLSCDRSHNQPSPPPCPCPCDNSCESGEEGPQPLPLTTAPGANNSLPHKLRHKSRLGDKDVASALLSLQSIKQEPGPLSSPPWDGEGSSDERDSGISMGGEWPSHAEPTPASPDPEPERMKNELARLASEVANLKSFLSIKKPSQ